MVHKILNLTALGVGLAHADKNIKRQTTADPDAERRGDGNQADPVARLHGLNDHPDCQRYGRNGKIPNQPRRCGIGVPRIHHCHDVPRVGLKPRDEIRHRVDRAPDSQGEEKPAHLKAKADTESPVRRPDACSGAHAVRPDVDACISGRAKRRIVGTARCDKCQRQQNKYGSHHDKSFFQRAICARTLSGAVPP